MPFEIPPFPSDRCTRCYRAIAPGAWTLATVDGRRHETCSEKAPPELATEPTSALAVAELHEVAA